MKKGKLIAFTGSGQPLQLLEYPLDEVAADEILVRNLYTTICGSDLHTYCGLRQEPSPTVLGHEIVGEIIAIGKNHEGLDLKGHPLHIGDVITWSIFSSDPDSLHSKRGMPQKGANLFKYGHALLRPSDAFHGGLAEYCKLRANTGILKIPEILPIPLAATINCAMATVAGAIRLSGDIKGKDVLISGMGLLGISCVAMCREAGAASIIVADICEKRLTDARSYGADATLDISKLNQEEITDQVRQINNSRGVDLAFDMSGAPAAMEMGLDLLEVGGKAIWVGAVFKTRSIQVNAEKIIRNLVTIKGLHNYNFEDLQYALRFLTDNFNKYPFDTIIEKEFSLADAELAFQYAVQNRPLRVGIRINDKPLTGISPF